MDAPLYSQRHLPTLSTFLQGYYLSRSGKTHFITIGPNEATRALFGPVTFTHKFLGEYTTAPLTDAEGDALAPGMIVSTTTGDHVRVCSIPVALSGIPHIATSLAYFRPPSNVADTIAIWLSHHNSSN
jgi:hypothetical protein